MRSESRAQHSTWFTVRKSQQQSPTARSKNSLKICSPFVSTSWPRTTDGEPLRSVEVDARGSLKLPSTEAQVKKATKDLGAPVRTTKIKLHPRRQEDHVRLRKILGCVGWTYNQCVASARDPEVRELREGTIVFRDLNDCSSESGKMISWSQFLRERLVRSDSPAVAENPWLQDVGYDIRDSARKEFLTSMKGCWTKLRNGSIDKFKLRFRSRKKSKSESFYVRSRWIEQTPNSIVLKLPGQPAMELWSGKRAQQAPIVMDCRLQRTWTGEYYLCVPQSFEPLPPYHRHQSKHDGVVDENQVRRQLNNNAEKWLRVCSLDPGVRTFQTIFDVNEGVALQVGSADMNRIFRLCYALDQLISKQAKEQKSKRRCKLKRAARRLRTRIRNLVDEVHKQLAKFLATNYDLVLIPSFNVSEMIRKGERCINSTTARQMVTCAHYRFRQPLLFKCRQYGCKVAVVNEAYTSKTCSCCGYVKYNLRGAKVFKCPSCAAVMDRDVNGAKNIFLRNYEALEMKVISSIGAYPLQCSNGLLHGNLPL